MAIPLTTEQRDLLRSGNVALRTLVDFHLDSGRYSFWDGDDIATFDGQQYLPASDFGEISAISMGQDLGAEGIEVRVNGTKLMEMSPDPLDPGALFGTIGSENYQNRRFDVRFAFFHPETLELVLLIKRYAGFIDQMRQVEDIQQDLGAVASWLIISIESIVRRYGVRGGRTRSNDDQQAIWPGDTGYKYTGSTISTQRSRFWGRNAPTSGQTGVVQPSPRPRLD